MSNVCAEQHKFHSSHQLLSPKKSLIDIPPRKLLTRRAAASSAAHDGAGEMFSDETFFQKYLPHNNPYSDSDSDSDDPYSSDHFRIYEFKVRRCTRSRSHDWTDCPFAHPGEKARRRDPRRYHYSGTVCPEYRRGACTRGDACEFAHGVFECWLHPARYRTEACKDGKNCKRKVCFFAHTPRQLRILPVTMNSASEFSPCKKNKFLNNVSGSNKCCLFCHCGGGNANNPASLGATSSPTSTLFGMSHFSPPSSPPLSPVKPRKGVSQISRYGACNGAGVNTMNLMNQHGMVSYKEALTELMSSMEKFNFSEGSPVSAAAAKASNLPWLDVSMSCEDQHQFNTVYSPSVSSSFGCEDQQQFILSPSTETPTSSNNGRFSKSKFLSDVDNKVVGGGDVINGSNCPAPDLGWVNELLM